MQTLKIVLGFFTYYFWGGEIQRTTFYQI